MALKSREDAARRATARPLCPRRANPRPPPQHPTAAWTAQQLVDTLPDDSAPPYLLRDRDGIYRQAFRQRVKGV